MYMESDFITNPDYIDYEELYLKRFQRHIKDFLQLEEDTYIIGYNTIVVSNQKLLFHWYYIVNAYKDLDQEFLFFIDFTRKFTDKDILKIEKTISFFTELKDIEIQGEYNIQRYIYQPIAKSNPTLTFVYPNCEHIEYKNFDVEYTDFGIQIKPPFNL